MKNKTYIEHDAMKQMEGGKKVKIESDENIEKLLNRVSVYNRLALIRFMNGDCVDAEVLEALKELARVEKQVNYEELMAEMFDDVLK